MLSGGQTGADQALTTLPTMPAVETTTASSLTQTAATLNATVNPNGATISDCHFEYGTATSYGASAPCTAWARKPWTTLPPASTPVWPAR